MPGPSNTHGTAGHGAGSHDPDTHGDKAPGDSRMSRNEAMHGLLGYLVGLGLATGLTVVSFLVAGTTLVWQPSIPTALIVLAVAQMGVHIVFFLHITTGPDNINNVMALAFGVLICLLVVFGSLWIMTHLNHQQMPVDQMTRMMR